MDQIFFQCATGKAAYAEISVSASRASAHLAESAEHVGDDVQLGRAVEPALG